jgi:hypothetical protein
MTKNRDIVEGKFRQMLVSPEIAISAEFQKAVLLKEPFIHNLCAVFRFGTGVNASTNSKEFV